MNYRYLGNRIGPNEERQSEKLIHGLEAVDMPRAGCCIALSNMTNNNQANLH